MKPDNDSTIQSSGFDKVPQDCLDKIVEYTQTKEWIQFSYLNKKCNAMKFCKRLMIHKQRSINWAINTSDIERHVKSSRGTLFSVNLNLEDTTRDMRNVAIKIFPYLSGTIHTLDMSDFRTDHPIDDIFSHLKGTIHTLDVSNCHQITDKVFSYLQGTIHTLDVSNCHQITDKAFSYLQGTIHTLKMNWCGQPTVTDEAFSYMKGTIRVLSMIRCDQIGITDKAFSYLQGIDTLDMLLCDQKGITSEMRNHLQSTVRNLRMYRIK